MIDLRRKWHSSAMSPRLRASLGLACLCACVETPADASDGEIDDELPEADCATVPTVLDEPVASWAEAQPNSELSFVYEAAAVMPGGDLVWIAEHERVVRWTPDGQQVWSYEADDLLFDLATSAIGEIVARGRTPDAPEDALPLLMRLDADGNFLQRELTDELGGAVRLAVTPGGDTIAALVQLGTEGLRLASFDRDLQVRWIVDTELHHDLATDSDGNVYTVHMRSTQGEPLDFLWGVSVVARTADGELAWTSDEVEIPSTGMPGPQLAVGDLVYVAAPSGTDSHIIAFGRDGELAWTHDFQADGSNHHVAAIAASPCGGVWLGGQSGADWRASLSSMDSEGVLGPIVELSDPLPDDYHFYMTTKLLVSAFGDVVAIGDLQQLGKTPDRAWIKAF